MAIKSFNPGAFFLGTLVPSERSYLKILIRNARGHGYRRFVEPCAGAFAMSHLAAEVGWPHEDIDASDITLFTSVMGYAITGESLEPFHVRAEGFEKEDTTDPAIVL